MGAIETLDKGIARIEYECGGGGGGDGSSTRTVSNKQQQPTSPPVQLPPAAAAPRRRRRPYSRHAKLTCASKQRLGRSAPSDAKKGADEGGRTKTRVRRHKSSAGSSGLARLAPFPHLAYGWCRLACDGVTRQQAQPQQQATATVMEALNAVSALLGGCDISSQPRARARRQPHSRGAGRR